MATPYVASILGILKAFNPDLTTQEAFELLSETGMETQNTAATGKLIQPYKALQKLKKPTGKSLVMSFLRKTIYY
jgi:thermitase